MIPGSGRSTGEGNGNPVLLPGKSHGQSSLVGYSPWGPKELDMTERLHLHTYSLTYFQPTERPPKTQQSKQKKRQRNIQQVKEHDKFPPNQTKEEEIGSLPEKKFGIMIVKMIQILKTKWSYR